MSTLCAFLSGFSKSSKRESRRRLHPPPGMTRCPHFWLCQVGAGIPTRCQQLRAGPQPPACPVPGTVMELVLASSSVRRAQFSEPPDHRALLLVNPALSPCCGARSVPSFPHTVGATGRSSLCRAGGPKASLARWQSQETRGLLDPFLLLSPFPPALSCRRQAWCQAAQGF